MSKTEFRLVTGGVEYRGFSRISVRRSNEEAASTFGFAVPSLSAFRRALFDHGVEIYADDDLLLTGWVDSLRPSSGPDGTAWEIAGRSKTGDVVDCSCLTSSISRMKIEKIADTLCAPYGVDVALSDRLLDTGEALSFKAHGDGETVYCAIERLARGRELLVTDDERGRLVLARAGLVKCSDPVIHGKGGNALSFGVEIALNGRFSEYRCVGTRSGHDGDGNVATVKNTAVTLDPRVRRTRVLVLQAEGQADSAKCRKRADWEAATRAGRSTVITAKVAGARQSDGVLWRPNRLCDVRSESLGVDGEYFLRDVEWSQDARGGTETTLTLCPTAGVIRWPQREKKHEPAIMHWDELEATR